MSAPALDASSPDPEFLFSEFAKNTYSFTRCGVKHLPSQLAGRLRQEKDLSPEVQDQTRVTARRMTTANFREGNGVTFGHTDT